VGGVVAEGDEDEDGEGEDDDDEDDQGANTAMDALTIMGGFFRSKSTARRSLGECDASWFGA